MTIFIAPIGRTTEHVKSWLKEESRDLHILWIIHSPKDEIDFPKIAKDLQKIIIKSYPEIKIKLKEITSAFEIDPTMDAISEIINEEMENDSSLINKDFSLNITGGTNAVAAATMISATWHGTRTYYILKPQEGDSKNKKYTIEVPVKPIGTAKMNENQLKVLKIIANSKYFIENSPKGMELKVSEGMITRQNLLEKLKWKTKKQDSGNGSTRLLGITKKLERSGYIEKIGHTEFYTFDSGKKLEPEQELEKSGKNFRIKIIENGTVKYEKWPLKIQKNDRESRYQITALGKRISRDAYIFK
jgi:hypothetical protein